MRTSRSPSVAALAVVALVALAACSEEAKPTRPVEAGFECVQRAAVASIAGAKEAPMRGRFSDGPPGRGVSGGGGTVFGALARNARFDWSALIAGARLGIAGLIVDQADAHARVLQEAGFVPIDAGASVSDPTGAPDQFAVSVLASRVGASGSHGWSAPRDAARIEHRRIYYAPGSGGFVVARIDYDGRDHTVCAELTYVEATVDGKYPAIDPKFSETVTAMPRKR